MDQSTPHLRPALISNMDDTVVKLTFELFPGRTLTLLPYEGVTNAREVFETLRAGKLADTGFFNPLYVRHPLPTMTLTCAHLVASVNLLLTLTNLCFCSF